MRFRINYNGQQISHTFSSLREAALARKAHPDDYETIWIQEWVDGGYHGDDKVWARVSEGRYRKAAGLT